MTEAERLQWLLAALEERFPQRDQPGAYLRPELRYIEALDRLLAAWRDGCE